MQREAITRFIEQQSDVPETLRSDGRFQKEVNDLFNLLQQQDMLELFAIHEIGHEIYFRKAGFSIFEYVPPTVIYRETDNERPFDGQLARIKPDGYTPVNREDWLLYLAKGYAAGGVCSEKLTTTDYGGDIHDRKLWNRMCEDCYKTQHSLNVKLTPSRKICGARPEEQFAES